ncbi:MAG: diaminopimelate epimerase [Thermomicrobiales bacterium]
MGQSLPTTVRIPFFKMNGSGNDFVVIDNRTGLVPVGCESELTRLVSRRRLAVGADGVVLIENADPASGADFRWRYINADGSAGEMCGNGAMCGARFAYLNDIAPAICAFETESGLIRAEVDPDKSGIRVSLAMVEPDPIQRDLALTAAGHDLTLHALQVGVPHAVLIVPDADAFPAQGAFKEVGRAVRLHSAFPEGTNFNVITVRDRQAIRMRTYERGVEDETLACGTGAVASAVVATALDLASPPIAVITSSGRPLIVDFAWNGEQAQNVRLTGEARIVATGEIWPEALE